MADGTATLSAIALAAHQQEVFAFPPTILAPADGTILRLGEAMLQWIGFTSLTNLINYEILVATDIAFTNIVLRGSTKKYKLHVALPFGATYYWVVRAVDIPSGYTPPRSVVVPAFSPASVSSHVADGLSRVLSQFLGVS